ncbi:hypothetical protein J6590_020975 [Homalodisca vitripennis]|nr:hypothetical protein J6590_020975 [Homalodisca vitripennis]
MRPQLCARDLRVIFYCWEKTEITAAIKSVLSIGNDNNCGSRSPHCRQYGTVGSEVSDSLYVYRRLRGLVWTNTLYLMWTAPRLGARTDDFLSINIQVTGGVWCKICGPQSVKSRSKVHKLESPKADGLQENRKKRQY